MAFKCNIARMSQDIRKSVTNCYYMDENEKLIDFLEDLFYRYAKERNVQSKV